MRTGDSSNFRKNISKYKKLANNPETSEVWITASGKDLFGLALADNKTGETGSNTKFVRERDEMKKYHSGSKGHIWMTGRLQSVESRSKSSEANSRRQPDIASRQNNNRNSRSDNIKSTME